jgi:hypothetical protein
LATAFRHKDVKQVLGKSPSSTGNFLTVLEKAGLIRKLANVEGYEKVDSGDISLSAPLASTLLM